MLLLHISTISRINCIEFNKVSLKYCVGLRLAIQKKTFLDL